MFFRFPMRYSPLVAACLLIGAGVFFLQTHHNRGPFWYGYDEEGKGRQVVEGFRNLNHPLLNVNVAALVYHQMDPGPQPIQQAVVVGRICAAAGVGLAAMSLAWLAWRRAGALAGGLVGLAMAVHPAFIHAAHFFKEDGLLVGTWGLLLLALDGFLCRPGAWTSGLAGVAAGLCASAKYVGFFPAVLGLGLLVRGSPGGTRWTQLGRVWVYLMAATAVWVGINHALIADGGRALSRIQVEVDMLFHETTTAGPAWQLLGRTSGWSGLLGLLIYVILRARQPRAWPRIEVFGMLTATLYVLGYFMLQRSAERYFLPSGWWNGG
jgi:4-amino-4-deoxy-L-arabinose transferase-like glycosyltransferase